MQRHVKEGAMYQTMPSNDRVSVRSWDNYENRPRHDGWVNTRYILVTQKQDSKTKQLFIIILFSSRLLLRYNTYPKETPSSKAVNVFLCGKKNIHQSNPIKSNHKTNNAAPIAAATKPLPAILTAPPVLVVPGVVEEGGAEGLAVTVPLAVPLEFDKILPGMVTP